MTQVTLRITQGSPNVLYVALRMAQGCCQDDTDHFTDGLGILSR